MKINTAFNGILFKHVLPLTALTLSTFAIPVQAAKFGVRVVDDQGMPVAGASVCIGLQGNYKQFGAAFTNTNGQVVVDVPNVPLLVTISKDRFTGIRAAEPARSFNLMKQVELKEGIPGPHCRAGSKVAEAEATSFSSRMLSISAIAVNDSGSKTTISPIVTGDPSHYRLSSNKEFSGAKWKKYSSKITLATNLARSEKVYLQLRKRKGSSRAWLETVSDVLTVRL